MLESLFNKVAQRSATQLKSDLITTFFTEQIQWLLLRFNSCFQKSPEQRQVRLLATNTNQLQKGICCRENSEAATIDTM